MFNRGHQQTAPREHTVNAASAPPELHARIIDLGLRLAQVTITVREIADRHVGPSSVHDEGSAGGTGPSVGDHAPSLLQLIEEVSGTVNYLEAELNRLRGVA